MQSLMTFDRGVKSAGSKWSLTERERLIVIRDCLRDFPHLFAKKQSTRAGDKGSVSH